MPTDATLQEQSCLILLNHLLFIKRIKHILEIIVNSLEIWYLFFGVLTSHHQHFSHFGTIIRCNINKSYYNSPQSELTYKVVKRDLYRYEVIFLACKYCINDMRDVIINSDKTAFKIMQCAFNLSNSGILRSRISTLFKIREIPIDT